MGLENMVPNLANLQLAQQMSSKYLDNDQIFMRELDENFVWFNGRPENIEVFFKNLRIFYSMSAPSMISAYDINAQQYNFWKDVGGEMARIHSGIPALMSKTYANLLKPSSMVMKILTDDGKVDEEAQKRLEDILKENQWHSLAKKGVITESWGGFFFLKLSYDPQLSEHPIIELIDPRKGRVKLKRGRIVGYKFSNHQIVGNSTFEIIEHYDFDKNRKIKTSYEVVKDGEKVKDIPKELEIHKDKILGIKFLPAFLKNNTAHSSKFPNKIYGESDYANSQSLLHMLDSLLSNLELDVDNSKAIQFVNKNIMDFDTENNVEMYNKHKLRIFLTNKIMDDPDFDINKIIGLFQPELRIEQFDPALKDITVRILANAGLSPTAVGMPGYESVNASNLSQTARRENSIISRDEKLELWIPFLEDFIKRLLQFDDFINGVKVEKDYNVFVEYNKYIAPDLNTLINIVVKAVNGGVMTLGQAIDMMWPDKSPDEKEEVVAKINAEMLERQTKAANAISSFDTPPQGQAVKTADTGRDTDEDKGVELDKYKK